MRTRNSYFPNNSNVTIPRRRNKGRAPNIVEPELRTIVTPMAERTMEELLQAPTEGYGEAIVLPEINADHFEIKTNLLQLVQANPFYGRESENPHDNQYEAWERFKELLRACPHHGFTELTQVDTFYNGLNENEQDSLNAAVGGNLMNRVSKRIPKTIPSPESDVPKSLPKPNIPYPSCRDDQKSRDKASNQMENIFKIFQDLRFDINFADSLPLMPRFAPTIKSCS
ncbi:hypothetical protein Tco_0722833 [Tanacetum coccineum]